MKQSEERGGKRGRKQSERARLFSANERGNIKRRFNEEMKGEKNRGKNEEFGTEVRGNEKHGDR